MKIVIIFFIAMLLGCSSNSSDEPNAAEPNAAEAITIDFTVIMSGAVLEANQVPISKRAEVIRDPSSALETLAEYNIDEILISNTDFNQKQVVLLSLGVQGGASYSLNINEVELFDDYAKMDVTYIFPGVGCLGVAASTIPRFLVEVNTTSELLIQEQLRIEDCL